MEIIINNLIWNVLFLPEIEIPNREDQSLCGLTDKVELKIYINKEIPYSLVKRTIIHEITHAFFWSYGWENFEKLEQEDVCNFIETHAEEIVDLSRDLYNQFKGIN